MYNIHRHELDWYEWSIDSKFIEVFADTLSLVIGTNDTAIDVRHVEILDRCRTIYTDKSHAMSLLMNMREWVLPKTCVGVAQSLGKTK